MLDTVIKWLVPAVLGSAATYLATLSGKSKAFSSGLQCLLRSEIIRAYDKYTDRKHIPIYAKEALEKEYKAYNKLGGNDVATDLYKHLLMLPVEYGKEDKPCLN
ncbi:MAG: hypothetical protein J5766_05315 [Clostridia bacterium]|nr:hypothetical protein [Clostridia bacterium]